jgi:hypothetical protein
MACVLLISTERLLSPSVSLQWLIRKELSFPLVILPLVCRKAFMQVL